MFSLTRSTESKILDSVLKEARINKKAIEFSNQESYNEYMKEHPDADAKNHSVKKEETKEISKDDKSKLEGEIEKKKQEIEKKPEEKNDSNSHADSIKATIEKQFEKRLKSEKNKKNPISIKKFEEFHVPKEIGKYLVGKNPFGSLDLDNKAITLKEQNDIKNIVDSYNKKNKTKIDLKECFSSYHQEKQKKKTPNLYKNYHP